MSAFTYFDQTMSLEQAKKTYRQMSRRLHPDLGGDEEQQKALNVEWQAFQDFIKTGRLPTGRATSAPAPTTQVNVSNWWQSVVNAANQPGQAAGGAQQKSAPAGGAQRKSAAPRSMNQQEWNDYQRALNAWTDRDGYKVHGNVTILWQDHHRPDRLDVIEIRGSRPRYQILTGGRIKYEQPATRSWKRERKQVIAMGKTWV